MTDEQFWYGDIRILQAKQIAYFRNISYTAWKQGDFARIATEIGAKNALITKQSDHIDKWIEWDDPIKKMEKPQITKENLEQEFRQSQASQNAWLRNILHK